MKLDPKLKHEAEKLGCLPEAERLSELIEVFYDEKHIALKAICRKCVHVLYDAASSSESDGVTGIVLHINLFHSEVVG